MFGTPRGIDGARRGGEYLVRLAGLSDDERWLWTLRADGTPAQAPGPAAAALMQKVVWDVVRRLPQTGVGG